MSAISHGTVRGYRQHHRRGIAPCDLCRDAYAKSDPSAARRAQIVSELSALPPPTRREGWASEAACADPDVAAEWFHPEPPTPRAYVAEQLAKLVCAKCPLSVRAECLAEGEIEAEWLGEYHGIRGGLTAEERRRYRVLIQRSSAA